MDRIEEEKIEEYILKSLASKGVLTRERVEELKKVLEKAKKERKGYVELIKDMDDLFLKWEKESGKPLRDLYFHYILAFPPIISVIGYDRTLKVLEKALA